MSGNLARSLKALLAASLILVSIAAIAPARAARQSAPGQAARDSRLVFPLLAIEKDGRLVSGLKPEDLRVTLEGAEQRLVDFSQGAEEPLHVVIMLDASASQERILPFARQAAAEFVATLLRPGRDDAAVVRFTGDAEVVQELTGDPAAVRRAIASVEFVPPLGYVSGMIVTAHQLPSKDSMRAASTAIHDALAFVCDKLFARAKAGRRVVVLVSDGVDTSSRLKLDKAVERLQREGAAVYSLGIGDTGSFDPVEKDALRKLSERTGGQAHFPKDEKDLSQAFEQVRQGLLSSYSAAFAPQSMKGEGKLHKLRVEVVNPELRRRGVELSYPRGLSTKAGR